MSTVFFTSDPHWGHEWVAGLRGFDSPQEHDDALLFNFTQTVSKRDIVYWLGDMTMRSPEYAIEMTKKIPAASHRLILGNHDRGHPMFRDSARWQKRYFEAFDSVATAGMVRVGPKGTRVLLSHFPYDGEGDPAMEDRHVQWRLRDERMLLLHGHTHTDRALGYSRYATPMLHVGLDAWDMNPVPLDWVTNWVRNHES